jgi:carbon monoxide dehydrogenase subunit G
MSADLQVARLIEAPAEQVWGVLTDWERQGEWMPATRVRSVHGHAPGGRIEAWTGLGRLGFLDTMEITRWDPPRRCDVIHTGRVLRGSGWFAVEPLEAGRCRVVWEERLELPLGRLGRAGWPVVRPLARAGLQLGLRRFARLVTGNRA